MTLSQDVLNAAQRHAVEMPGGALLILAGPGSGKTRVIAHRIAQLVEARAVPPWRILAVTFTNKAAAEMRERVELLLGERARDLSMGTFHSICARILRRDGEPVGLPREFAIYDTDDQMAIVRGIAGELALDPRRFAPRALLSAISAAKNERRSPAAVLSGAGSYFEEVVGRTFERYEAALRRSCAADFDDLLGRTLELFERSPETLQRYADRYLHVLIDEFQDTNLVQYELARAFASVHRNITAVGDPDQSIYSWRAADVRNLQHFERDFPGAQVVLLEQNYRSTGHILRAAHAVIARAEGRPQRELWTENPDGAPVVIQELYDGDEEALFIASEVRRLTREDGRRPGDIAVMYRTNAQSRAIEEACVEHGIRYRIVGGTRFYERREVRDLLAYLRLVHNAADGVAFARIANVPTRGIGQKTLADLGRAAEALGIGPLAVAARAARGDRDPALPQLRGDIRAALSAFVALIDGFAARTAELNVAELLDAIVRDTDYRAHLQRSDPDDAEARWENVQELRTVAAQYEDLQEEQSLTAFLEEVALVADVDDPAAGVPDAVTLTTLHAAKGLEYAVVFMPGMEEGLLPHIRALDDPPQMEEERRLCYVGMTRARERLYLTHALRRLHNGAYRNNIGSRFLADVPALDRAGAAPGTRTGSTLSPRERRAALAARVIPAVATEPQLAPGDRVRHAAFGPGVVVSCIVRGDDQEVAVAFEGAGVKRLLLSLAPLELDS
ncbi:MAG: AAA family ATPase [Dehalococcoidia bacterium]|nr:AAA family ATPase [Dehalococcoidia bacterium]